LSIKKELEKRLKELEKSGKNLEAERLKRRTNYDLALIKEVGYCNGIENYSRHFSDKKEGEAPDTLLAYFPHKVDGSADFLTVIDESHVTIPQIGGMYAGDASRKNNLIEYGFRLPSARDNRPLKFDEFEKRIGQALFVSATPSRYEKEHSDKVIEQVIRPTGLIDPMLEVRGVIEDIAKGYGGQIKDFIIEAEKTIAKGFRVIGTTLTKKMAEDLTEFLKEKKIKAEYLHSDIDTLERIQILTNFRKGTFDVLIGVNLLREGIDIPELAFIGIFDADKEGFLRSETSLIQIIGRAARNTEGKVVLYADSLTNSLESAMSETARRRKIQIEFNTAHNITPKTIQKNIKDITDMMQSEHQKTVGNLAMLDSELFKSNPEEFIERKRFEMDEAVARLDFETAAIIRDEISALVEKSGLTLDTFKKRKKASRFKR
jgi:excinuclease ABC subunit B